MFQILKEARKINLQDLHQKLTAEANTSINPRRVLSEFLGFFSGKKLSREMFPNGRGEGRGPLHPYVINHDGTIVSSQQANKIFMTKLMFSDKGKTYK